MADPHQYRNDTVMRFFGKISAWKAILIGFPVVMVILLSATVFWLLNTASGAAWLWNRLEGSSAIDLRSSQLSGDLASGFIVRDMEYRSNGLDVLVRRAEIEAGLGWWPFSVQVAKLSLQDVDVVTRASEDSAQSANAGNDIRATLAGIKLPVPLEISDALLTRINLKQNEETSFRLFESVSFKLAMDDRLVVDHLEMLAESFETSLQGQLQLQPPFELNVTSQGRFAAIASPGDEGLEVPFKLDSSGDLDKLRVSISSHKYGLLLEGEVFDPLELGKWDIRADMDHIAWPESDTRPELALSSLQLVSEGSIQDWTFKLDSTLQLETLDARIAVSGSGTATDMVVSNATVSGTGVDLGLSGKLDWSSQAEAAFKAVISELDLSAWVAGWPAGELLAGKLELNWSGSRLEIPASQLTIG